MSLENIKSDFSNNYIDKVNDVISTAKNNIAAVVGKKGSGKETFLNEVKNTINQNYNSSNQDDDNRKQSVLLENINTDNFISNVIDNVFPDSANNSSNNNVEQNDKSKNNGIKNIKALVNVPTYDEIKQKKLKHDIDTVTNKITNSDYNKLQRKYTIISLVASVLASLGSSIFILGCTNLRYLLSPSSTLINASDWAQTLGLIVPGVTFILISWLLFYLYYRNYKTEKNMPMNLEDQSNILLKLINNLSIKKSDFKKITFRLTKILDLRSYFHFRSIFLSNKKNIIIVPTVFIINNFSILNINEQMDLLKSMSILEKSKYLDFIVFLNDEDLNRIGDEQIRLLHKYLPKFVEIKYDYVTASKILDNWLDNNFNPDDKNNLWFRFASNSVRRKIYFDLKDILSNFANEVTSYEYITNFINDMNTYLNQIGLYIQYINPMEIIIIYLLKYSREDIFNYINSNGSSSLNISFSISELNNPSSINSLINSTISQDKFISILIRNNEYLQKIKAFNYLFTNIKTQDSISNQISSKFYKKYYSLKHIFIIFSDVNSFIKSITLFINNLNRNKISTPQDLFNLLNNFEEYKIINPSGLFNNILVKNLDSSSLMNFVKNKIMLFLTKDELINSLTYPFNKKYDEYHYLYTLAKMYSMAIISDEELFINELKSFDFLLKYINDLVTTISNEDMNNKRNNILNNLKSLILQKPELFYSIFLMINVSNYDLSFFDYNFQFNLIEKEYITIFEFLTDGKTYNSILDFIKNYSINWQEEQSWQSFGFIWLRYYLLNTQDEINTSNLLKTQDVEFDYLIFTFILLNYQKFISIPNIIPFKNLNVIFKNRSFIKLLIENDVNNIFKKQVIDDILRFKIGEIYYEYNIKTNEIKHKYIFDSLESYGAFN